MSWRERMGPASFRGVTFYVDVAELAGGRRTVTHEFPLRDQAYVEDLGGAARTLPVEGYVLGDNYLERRDALIAALEAAGPGELVHPHHGTRRVICSEFHVRESSREGGIARFAITFVETISRPAAPARMIDAVRQIRSSAAVARAAAGTEFLSEYEPGGLLESAHDLLRTATLRVGAVHSTIERATQEVALFESRIERLLDSVVGLASAPENLFTALTEIFGFLDNGEALAAYRFDPGPEPIGATPARETERRNFRAISNLVHRLAAIRAAEASPDGEYDSTDAATAARDAVTAALDEQMEAAGDELYAALVQLRADLARAVPDPSAALPRLVRYLPPYTVPSLVLAHRLYGDVRGEADILARNRIAHPGFVRGGIGIEVLSRA